MQLSLVLPTFLWLFLLPLPFSLASLAFQKISWPRVQGMSKSEFIVFCPNHFLPLGAVSCWVAPPSHQTLQPENWALSSTLSTFLFPHIDRARNSANSQLQDIFLLSAPYCHQTIAFVLLSFFLPIDDFVTEKECYLFKSRNKTVQTYLRMTFCTVLTFESMLMFYILKK